MKQLTKWKTKDGFSTVTATTVERALLLETGFNLLLENGGKLLLESTTITPKKPTGWIN